MAFKTKEQREELAEKNKKAAEFHKKLHHAVVSTKYFFENLKDIYDNQHTFQSTDDKSYSIRKNDYYDCINKASNSTNTSNEEYCESTYHVEDHASFITNLSNLVSNTTQQIYSYFKVDNSDNQKSVPSKIESNDYLTALKAYTKENGGIKKGDAIFKEYYNVWHGTNSNDVENQKIQAGIKHICSPNQDGNNPLNGYSDFCELLGSEKNLNVIKELFIDET